MRPLKVRQLSIYLFFSGIWAYSIIGEKPGRWQEERQVVVVQTVLPSNLAVEDHTIVPENDVRYVVKTRYYALLFTRWPRHAGLPWLSVPSGEVKPMR
jgi:hypothetical protein